MDKIRVTNVHYYPDADELDLVINVARPREAISVPVDDEFFFLRVDPAANEVVGATILNASRWFETSTHAFATGKVENGDIEMIETKAWSRDRFPVVYEGDQPKAVLVDIDVFEQVEMILDNLLNREGEPEDAITSASGLLATLIERAQTEHATTDWERKLDEL